MREKYNKGGEPTFENQSKGTKTTAFKEGKNPFLLKEWANRKESGASVNVSIDFNKFSQDSGSPLFMVNRKSSTLLDGTLENSTIGHFGDSTYARSKNFTTGEEIESFEHKYPFTGKVRMDPDSLNE